MDKISISLYGGKGLLGGRETPLEADIIYCEMSEKCSYYSAGKCLRNRAFLKPEMCKYGRVERERGYTSRAAKYYEWKKRYTSDSVYSKLQYPNTPAAVIGDWLYLYTAYVSVTEHREDRLYPPGKVVNGFDISDPGFTLCSVFIPMTDATNELLYAIFSFRPRAMMGGIITEYQNKYVPEMLQEIHKVAPELYNRFVGEYPEYILEPNYIGKTVYVDSLKPGTVFRVEQRGEWMYDGEYVTAVGGIDVGLASPWWSQGGGLAEGVRIKVNPKMTFRVMENSIVDDDTRFA